jgi:LPXTG-site transpeptidase (sortase) family protein
MKKKGRKRLSLICLLLAVSCLIGAAAVYYQDNREAYERMAIEREIADEYLAYILSDPDADAHSTDETGVSTVHGRLYTTGDDLDDSDQEPQTLDISSIEDYAAANEYYNWSPDYAQGTLDCIFEYPELNIRRGVYKGAIENDLACWMVVTANDDCVLGKTPYTIYGHNSITFEVSLNALLNAELGQTFTLTNTTGEYAYVVTDIMYMSREEASAKYAHSLDNPVDKAYILTCGRYEHRYTDMVLEGTLTTYTSVAEMRKRAQSATS